MDIFTALLALILMYCWPIIILIVIVLLLINYPGVMVPLLILTGSLVLLYLLITLLEKREKRKKLDAWEELTEDEKKEWEKVKITVKWDQKDYYFKGQKAFFYTYSKNYKVQDFFRKRIKNFPEIPIEGYDIIIDNR